MKYAGRILLSTLVLAGALKYGYPKIKDWAEKNIKKLEQIEYNYLKQYVIGTRNIQIKLGENYWKLASEDIKNNPKLQKMIDNREIDTHSLIAFYKEINKGYPVGAGTYKRPIWNFYN